ncbi:hypothetical protein GC102_11120 [Paenibacillus sp. LMG 31460]|uniref:Uncharacterized protein n=1 Tax=Paenibacillus germinis TaxID=2654979 RepID=A0ABX1YZA8_9BACL|nr:hypothetical protein [Paenibacillus germinis]NOU86321.1 hypothetical protein [Paenibacillus germinis]
MDCIFYLVLIDLRRADPTYLYPPGAEDEWELLVNMLEEAVGSYATVDVSGDMPVGKTGKVNMCHGQLNPRYVYMAILVDGRSNRAGQAGGAGFSTSY